MRNTLICTVGTSLMGRLDPPTAPGFAGLAEHRDPMALAKALRSIAPEDPAAGAEINSVAGIVTGGMLAAHLYLYLLVSETADGAFLGNALSAYFEDGGHPLGFENVAVREIAGLTHESPGRFQAEGLRNLVREIADIVRCHNEHYVLINATGGYKAQISFAGLIGQALDIPVCYLFERFSEVITLPPMPVSLDMGFWLAHTPVFLALAEDGFDRNPSLDDPGFAGLVELIARDRDEDLFGLSATGQLFHETCLRRFRRHRADLLPPEHPVPPTDKVIKLEDGNRGKHKGLEDYLRRLCHRPYVVRAYTHYYNPDLRLAPYFRPSAKGGVSQVEGAYSDGKATTRFDVVTTAETRAQQQAAVADLMGLIG